MTSETTLPSEELEKIAKSNKKRGIWRTLLLQGQLHWVKVLFAVFGLIGTIYGASNDPHVRNFIFTINSNNNNTSSNVLSVEDSPEVSKNEENKEAMRELSEFKPDDWIIDNFYIDKEGYYCNNQGAFPHWYIWSKSKKPLEFSVHVRLKVKSMNPQKNPSVVLTYGEYIKNYSPDLYYRLVFFDSSDRAIRLYNKEDNVSKVQEYLDVDKRPDFTNEMVITMQPKIPSVNGRKININPSIEYNSLKNDAPPVPFKPKKEFEISLPTVQLDDSIQKQIGIGVDKWNCIKPIRVDFSN